MTCAHIMLLFIVVQNGVLSIKAGRELTLHLLHNKVKHVLEISSISKLNLHFYR